MIILDVEQGSPEWFEARRGIPTASNFDKILTATKKMSTQASKYMIELIADKHNPEETEQFSNIWTERGKSLEEEARSYYELITDLDVQQVGLVYLDDMKQVSCSPDGLIQDDGGIEIKCLKASTHIEMFLNGGIPVKYVPQIQGNLWVTGRQWWDFFAYHPSFKCIKIRVGRDEEYIQKLREAISSFLDQMAKLEAEIIRKDAVTFLKEPPKIDEEQNEIETLPEKAAVEQTPEPEPQPQTDTKTVYITTEDWGKIYKNAFKVKNPDGKPLSGSMIFGVAKQAWGVKNATEITVDQAKEIVHEWFPAWQNGTFDQIEEKYSK